MVHRLKLGPFGSKFLSIWLESKAKELMVHVGNAPAHNSKMTRNLFEHNPLKRLLHPPSSPDISPSDFYLFKKVKGVLIGQAIPDEISLLDAVTEIVNRISTDELQRVFAVGLKALKM
jgi:histone-lysine N-methyltransferase SETMAR